MDRRVPERDERIVDGRYRHRAAGHLERGHVAASETARRRQPGGAKDSTRGVRHEVEFERWRAAEAVDEEQHGRAALEPQVIENRIHELVGDAIGSGERDAPAPRLAVDADAHFHLILAELKGGLAGGRHRARGERDAHRAGAYVDVLAQRLERHQIAPGLGRGADHLLNNERAGDAAPSGRIGGSLDRDIVVDDDGPDLPPDDLRRHLEVHDVAFVVLDDEETAGPGVDGRRGFRDLVGRRRGEDLTRAGGVEHADTHEAGMERLVPRAAAGEQRDLTRLWQAPAHELALRPEHDDVGMRGGEAIEALGKDSIGGIHQLLHDGTSLRTCGFLGGHSMSSTNFRSRRTKSAIIASTARLRLASPRSGTASETMRVRGTAWTRAKRRGWARR